MKRFLIFCILLALCGAAYAQEGNQGVPTGGGGLTLVATLPATCVPGTTQPVQLSVSPYTIYTCTATNTWTQANSGIFGSTCSGTVSTQDAGNGNFSPCTYGAVADAMTLLKCSVTTSSPIINCPSANFLAPANSIVGDIAFITTDVLNGNTDPSGGVQFTIASVQSATQLTLNSGTGITALTGTAVFNYGHDDTAALNATLAACQLAVESYISACNVALPCSGMLVQAPVKFTTVASYPTTYTYGMNMHGCLVTDGTASVLLMSPTFSFTNCNVPSSTGCFGNPQEGFYGQDNLTDFSIYQGGYASMAPGSNIYLLNPGTQAVMRDVYILGNFNNTNVNGFVAQTFLDAEDLVCYQVGNVCLTCASGSKVFLHGEVTFLSGGDALDLAGGCVFQAQGYTQYVGGSACVRFNGGASLYDVGGIFGEGCATALYFSSGTSILDLQDDQVAGNSATLGTADWAGGNATISFRNTAWSQTNAGGNIFLQTSGTAILNDLGSQSTFTSTAAAISGTVTVMNTFSADNAALTTGGVSLPGGSGAGQWGTSTITAVGTNSNSHKGSFTITGAGVPGATPIATLTFPTAYPLIAPAVCTFQQIAGTFGVLTNPVSGTPGKTTVTMTLTGTAVAAQTYTFAYNCGP